MPSNTAKLESKKKPLLNEISTKKKSKKRQNITINKADIEERNKSLMAKCSKIIITANNSENIVERKVKNNYCRIIKLQLLKQQTNDKIVGWYCKQRN